MQATTKPRKIDPDSIPSYWIANVTYNNPSSCMVFADTLPEVLASAVENATYYLGIGYKAVQVEIEQRCQTCNGTGEAKRNNLLQPAKPCKACKGNPILSSIPAFPVRCHENVKIVDPGDIGRSVDDIADAEPDDDGDPNNKLNTDELEPEA